MNRQGLKIEGIRIVRSPRRRKTVSARLVSNILYIHAPMHISSERLDELTLHFKNKFQRDILKKELNKQQDLRVVADELNKKYFSGRLHIRSIGYVTNQETKFGCCNYKTGIIRISSMVASMPLWVRDYVVMHEIAHLVEPNHSKAFWDIVSRYKLSERARGFLIAKGLEKEEA